MKLDPVLLDTACRYSNKSYNDHIPDSIKIESRLTSTTAYIMKRNTIDIICFRGSRGLHDWLFNLSPSLSLGQDKETPSPQETHLAVRS